GRNPGQQSSNHQPLDASSPQLACKTPETQPGGSRDSERIPAYTARRKNRDARERSHAAPALLRQNLEGAPAILPGNEGRPLCPEKQPRPPQTAWQPKNSLRYGIQPELDPRRRWIARNHEIHKETRPAPVKAKSPDWRGGPS